jgi:hypothetical protein
VEHHQLDPQSLRTLGYLRRRQQRRFAGIDDDDALCRPRLVQPEADRLKSTFAPILRRYDDGVREVLG